MFGLLMAESSIKLVITFYSIRELVKVVLKHYGRSVCVITPLVGCLNG